MNKPVISIIFIHLAGWLMFFSFILLFGSEVNKGQSISDLFSSLEFLVFAIIYLFIFYSNYFFLFEYFYLRKFYLSYFSILILFFIGMFFLKPFDHLVHMMGSINVAPKLNFGDPIAQNRNIGSIPFKRGPKIDFISLAVCVLL